MATMIQTGTSATWNGATYSGGPGAGTNGSPGVGDTLTVNGDLTITAADAVDVGLTTSSATAAIAVNGTLRIRGACRIRTAGIFLNNGGTLDITDPSGVGYTITLDGAAAAAYIRELGTTGVTIQVLGASPGARITIAGTGASGAQFLSATAATGTWTLHNVILDEVACSNADGGPKGVHYEKVLIKSAAGKTHGVRSPSTSATLATTSLPLHIDGLDLRNITWVAIDKGTPNPGVERSIKNVTVQGGAYITCMPKLDTDVVVSDSISIDLSTTIGSLHASNVNNTLRRGVFLASTTSALATNQIKTAMQAGNTFTDCILVPYSNPGSTVNFRGVTEYGTHQGVGRNYFTNSFIDGWGNGPVSDFYLGIGDREYDGIIATGAFGNISDGAGNFATITATTPGIIYGVRHCTLLYSGGNPGVSYNYGAIGIAEEVYGDGVSAGNDLVRDVESCIFYKCTHGLCLSVQSAQVAGQLWTRQANLRLRGNVTQGLQVDGGMPRPGGAGQSYLYRPTGDTSPAILAALVEHSGTITSRSGRQITHTGATFQTWGYQANDVYYVGNTLNPNGTAQKGWVIASVDAEDKLTFGPGLAGTTDADLPAAGSSYLLVKGWWANGAAYGDGPTTGSLDVYTSDVQLTDPDNATAKAWAISIDPTLSGQTDLQISARIIAEMLKLNGIDASGAAATFNAAWHPDNLLVFVRAKVKPLATSPATTAAASYDVARPYAGAVAPDAPSGGGSPAPSASRRRRAVAALAGARAAIGRRGGGRRAA